VKAAWVLSTKPGIPKLDRLVALKFLPPHLNASEQDEALFLQEARAAAALNHPHICTIYGVEEDAGRMFIVMEFIEGGTLREKIPYARVDDAIDVAIQIGEALQDAHASGIVHRDIKPDNVMLTSKGSGEGDGFRAREAEGTPDVIPSVQYGGNHRLYVARTNPGG